MSALDREIRMRARYVGRCTVCDGPIHIGEEIFYAPIRGARHADEDGCYSAQDALRQYDDWEDPMEP